MSGHDRTYDRDAHPSPVAVQLENECARSVAALMIMYGMYYCRKRFLRYSWVTYTAENDVTRGITEPETSPARLRPLCTPPTREALKRGPKGYVCTMSPMYICNIYSSTTHVGAKPSRPRAPLRQLRDVVLCALYSTPRSRRHVAAHVSRSAVRL